MNFELIFNNYYSVLQKYNKQLSTFGLDLEKIRMIKKTLEMNEKYFSYSFTTLNFYVPKALLPSNSIPKEFQYIEIILSIKDEVVIKKIKKNNIEDPLIKLNKFNIILYTDEKKYTSSWHLDRHEMGEDEQSPSNLHPIYHLTFGGYHMEELQKDDSVEFGRSLILRTPRIMHPPMELILGIDFIFNNFIPKSELDLLSDPTYISVINELKKYFWLPYSLAIAKNYCERISINNEPFSFDELFVSSVLSC